MVAVMVDYLHLNPQVRGKEKEKGRETNIENGTSLLKTFSDTPTSTRPTY